MLFATSFFKLPPGTQALPELFLPFKFRNIRAKASGEAFLKWLRSVDMVCCVRIELLLFVRTSIVGLFTYLLISGRKLGGSCFYYCY